MWKRVSPSSKSSNEMGTPLPWRAVIKYMVMELTDYIILLSLHNKTSKFIDFIISDFITFQFIDFISQLILVTF